MHRPDWRGNQSVSYSRLVGLEHCRQVDNGGETATGGKKWWKIPGHQATLSHFIAACAVRQLLRLLLCLPGRLQSANLLNTTSVACEWREKSKDAPGSRAAKKSWYLFANFFNSLFVLTRVFFKFLLSPSSHGHFLRFAKSKNLEVFVRELISCGDDSLFAHAPGVGCVFLGIARCTAVRTCLLQFYFLPLLVQTAMLFTMIYYGAEAEHLGASACRKQPDIQATARASISKWSTSSISELLRCHTVYSLHLIFIRCCASIAVW